MLSSEIRISAVQFHLAITPAPFLPVLQGPRGLFLQCWPHKLDTEARKEPKGRSGKE